MVARIGFSMDVADKRGVFCIWYYMRKCVAARIIARDRSQLGEPIRGESSRNRNERNRAPAQTLVRSFTLQRHESLCDRILLSS